MAVYPSGEQIKRSKPAPVRITVELYDINGKAMRYDAYEDGPLNEWLASVAPKLGKEFQNLSRNATIRVFEVN